MYNIRIKSLPENAKTGSQLNYALVDRNTLFLKPDTSVKSEVKTTESGVPREEATIEAEGGEVRLTSTDDGYLKLMTILGKSHAQGGEPIAAKPGDFIYSKTKDLNIKDPEVVKMFGGVAGKTYTPADFAKKYQINAYVDTLKNPKSDVYSRNTAQLMLDNHTKKLGGLALVQESMKGFPDGIPAIAESVLAGMQGGQQGELPMAKYGGIQLPGYQKAGTYPKTNPPKKTIPKKKGPLKPGDAGYKAPDGYTGYWNRVGNEWWSRPSLKGKADPRMNQALSKLNPFSDEYTGEGAVEGVVDYVGNVFSMPQKELNHLMTGLYETPMTTAARYHKISPTVRILGDIATDPLIVEGLATGAVKKAAPYVGKGAKVVGKAAYKAGTAVGKAVAPVVEKVAPYAKKAWQAVPNKTKVIVAGRLSQAASHVTNYPKEPVTIDDLRDKIQKNQTLTPEEKQNVATVAAGVPEAITPGTAIPEAVTTPTPAVEEEYTEKPITKKTIYYDPRVQTKPADTKYVDYVAAQNSAEIKNPNIANQRTTVQQPVRTPVPVEPEVQYDILDEQMYGGIQYGDLDRYQQAGQVPKTPVSIKFDSKTGKNIVTYNDGTQSVEDPDITYNVADAGMAEEAQKRGYDMRYHPSAHRNRTYVPAQTRKTGFKVNPESGFYENKSYPIGQKGLQDYMELWGDELARYNGPSGQGPEAWKKDLMAQKGDEGPASKFIVDAANALSVAATGKPQVDIKQRAAYKPGVDVFNLKKFSKTPGIPDTPPPPGTIPPRRIPPGTQRMRDDWWIQDKINLAGILGDRVNKYGPAMRHYNFQTPDYALEDPAMLNQLALSQAANYQEGLYGTTAGNVAGATAASNFGKTAEQVALNQSQVQNRNVQTYNNASAQGAQIANQQNQITQEGIQEYMKNLGNLNNNYDIERKNQKWQEIAALNQGLGNYQRRQEQYELTPNAFIDPTTGEVSTRGRREMWNPDGTLAYDPRDAYGYGSGSGNIDTDAMYEHYKKQGIPADEIDKRVNARLKAYGIVNNMRGKKGATPGGYGYGAQAFNPYGMYGDDDNT